MTALALVAVERTRDGFVEAIRSAAERGASNLAVLPQDDLAKDIFDQVRDIPRTTAEQSGILCLTHQQREPLEHALQTQFDRNDGIVIIPRTAGHGLDRSLFLISIPKAGTHLMYQLAEQLGFRPGVICPEIPAPGYWYCLEYSNSHTVPRDFFVDSVRRAPFGNRMHPFPCTAALFAVRHPWDILVSEANYYPKRGKAVFSGFYEGLDFDAGIDRLLGDGALLGRFCDRVMAFEPWLHFENVIPIAFEDLVGELGGGDPKRQERLIWSIQVKLGVPGAPHDFAAKLFDPTSATFNKGVIGSHRNALSPGLKDHLDGIHENVLRAFGYRSGDSPYNTSSEGWRVRPLRYLDQRTAAPPVLHQANYLGHNLVQYLDRFYAVPVHFGPLDLSKNEQLLDSFSTANSLAELRATVRVQLQTKELQDTWTRNLASIGTAIEERTERLTGLEHTLGEMQQRAASLEATLAERDQRLCGLETALAERDQRLWGLEMALAERNQRLSAVEKTLVDRDQRLKIIEDQGLRRIRSAIRRWWRWSGRGRTR
jgi:hypothetical protein